MVRLKCSNCGRRRQEHLIHAFTLEHMTLGVSSLRVLICQDCIMEASKGIQFQAENVARVRKKERKNGCNNKKKYSTSNDAKKAARYFTKNPGKKAPPGICVRIPAEYAVIGI